MMDGYVVFSVVCFFFAAFLLGVGVGAAKTRREFNRRLTDMARRYRG
jgi:ABC-type Co2+ transport system permease subunit